MNSDSSEPCMLDLNDLSGKVAVVTGAASGLGRASAILLAEWGAAVVCVDISPKLEETVATIRQAGGKALAVPADVSNREQVEAAVERAVTEFGRIDIMCNVAGIMTNSLVIDLKDEDFDRVFGVNLKGVLYGCQSAARRMVAQESGSIINFASEITDKPSPSTASYGMAKAAVVQLTRTLAKEIGPHGVRVNAVAPGFVDTGITARHYTRPDGSIDEARRSEVIKGFNQGRVLPGRDLPENIATVVLFLASAASSSLTGQVIRANGGGSI